MPFPATTYHPEAPKWVLNQAKNLIRLFCNGFLMTFKTIPENPIIE
jgi:hypothetical protein